MYEALRRTPLRRLERVWHVGTVNAADKGSTSQEGSGLSVSLHPTDWRVIARLNGSVHELTRKEGSFLDFHKMTKAAREELLDWARRAGWIALERRWKVTWLDPEDEGARWCLFDTQARAEAEAEFLNEDEGAKATAERELVPVLTAEADSRVGFCLDPLLALDIAVTFWVEDELPDVDGVWWNDRLEPLALSAPRGVILKPRLNRWQVRPKGIE